MNIDPALAQFLDKPDTVGFIIRNDDYLIKYFQNDPNIILLPLTSRHTIIYANTAYVKQITDILETTASSAYQSVYGLLETETLEDAGIYQVQQQPYLNLKGRGVLIGFVDTGIDYTKEVFRYKDGSSKIQFLYDQTIRGNTPEGFYFGTEYTNAQINEALKLQNPYDIVPEKDTAGHGTFLASIAAGSETRSGFTGAAPDAELIVVKLNKAKPFYYKEYLIPPDQENAFATAEVMMGIEYILRKAKELDRPVAICFALGTNLDGHDGFTILEEYLTNIANTRGVCVCVAAGNESQTKHHFEGMLKSTGDEQRVDISVGENAGDIIIGIFSAAADRFSVSVRSPTGELVGRIPAKIGFRIEESLTLEKSRVMVWYLFPLETSSDQLTVVGIINATPGIWSIIIHGDIVSNGTYHAWLPITGFVSPTVKFLNPTPYTTTVVPATAFGIICCGASDSRTRSLYINSSWGPTRTTILKPDLVAPGVNVSGVYPTGYGTMSGTSVSAAITTGASALLLQWGIVNKNDISMSTYHIRAYLIRGCSRSETTIYPNQRWGYGSLNLMETFNLMREL